MGTILSVVVMLAVGAALLAGYFAYDRKSNSSNKRASAMRFVRVLSPLTPVGLVVALVAVGFQVGPWTLGLGFVLLVLSFILAMDSWLNWSRDLYNDTHHDDTLRA